MKKVLTLMLVVIASLGAYSQEPTRALYSISPNLNCQNCVERVQKALGAIEGIDSVNPSLATQTVEVFYDAKTLQPEIIVKALAEIGYTATPSTKSLKAVRSMRTAVVSPQAAAAMERVEDANPGPVMAIDGKPVNGAAHQCQGDACPSQKQGAAHQCAKKTQQASQCQGSTQCAKEAQQASQCQGSTQCAKEAQQASQCQGSTQCAKEAQQTSQCQGSTQCAKSTVAKPVAKTKKK